MALAVAVASLMLATLALAQRRRLRHRKPQTSPRPGGPPTEAEPQLSARFYHSPDTNPIGPQSGLLITNRSQHAVHELTVEGLTESDETGGPAPLSLVLWNRDSQLLQHQLHVGTVGAGESAYVAAVPHSSAFIARLRVTCRTGRREWAIILTLPLGSRSQWH